MDQNYPFDLHINVNSLMKLYNDNKEGLSIALQSNFT